VTSVAGGAKAAIAGVFDRAAPAYDRVGVDFFVPVGAELVAAAGVRRGDRVLDVGCGRGASLLPAAAAAGPEGTRPGSTWHPAWSLAAAEAERRGLSTVTVAVGDAEDPPVPAGSVDVVLAGLVLFFLPDAPSAARRYAKLLRPGGRLAVSTFAESTDADEAAYRRLLAGVLPLLPPVSPAAPDDLPPPERRLRSRESLAALLEPAGFTGLRFLERDFEVVFDRPERHWEWAWSHGMRALLERVPPDRLDEAGVPDDIEFATKPALAAGMLVRALNAGVRARWVAGDEVYGADPVLRAECEARRVGYVLAIGCDRRVPTAAGLVRADQITAGLPKRAWQRLSAGPGAKGQRYYDWAWITHPEPRGRPVLVAAGTTPPPHREAGVLPLLLPGSGSAARAGPGGRPPLDGGGIVPGRQGPRRARRAPGPPLDFLAALDAARDGRARAARRHHRR
jgi:ubiquinone/menaquinone biosynthesis C-methylase UbiE